MHPLLRSSLFDLTTPAISLLRALEEPLRPAAVPEEVTEDEQHYTLRVEVPGLREEQIVLDVTPTSLSLRGERTVAVPEGYTPVRQERSAYRVERRLRFGHRVDPEGVVARLQDGVLTVTLPKAEAAQARRVPVTVG